MSSCKEANVRSCSIGPVKNIQPIDVYNTWDKSLDFGVNFSRGTARICSFESGSDTLS